MSYSNADPNANPNANANANANSPALVPRSPTDKTSLCYINCYYSGLLGPASGTTFPSDGGLTGPEITGIWVDAFDACPDTGGSLM